MTDNVIDFIAKRSERKVKLPNFIAKTEQDVKFLLDNMDRIELPVKDQDVTCGS